MSEVDHRYATEEEVTEYCDRFSGQRCWNCRFFRDHEPATASVYLQDDGSELGVVVKWDGDCRRHAPKPIVVPDDDDLDRQTVWPVVQGHDYCGEYIEDDHE